MNLFFCKKRVNNSNCNNFAQEKYIFCGMAENIEKLSNHVVEINVVVVAEVLFKDSVKNNMDFDK